MFFPMDIIRDNTDGGFLKWGYPNSWMVFVEKIPYISCLVATTAWPDARY